MPKASSWFYFAWVNLIFIAFIFVIFYYNQVNEVKANWPMYRCNPMYMPLADDVQQNFTYCVQTSQSNFMGYMLQPLTFVTGSLTSMMGNMTQDIQNIRAMFDKIRNFLENIVSTIFGVFLNIVIEFQRITISIKDLIGKTIGIMTSLMFMMDGSVKTMNSTWNGPPGQMVRALGKCFYKNTMIEVVDENGQRIQKKMKDVKLGDILSDGSIVEATMQIDNRRERIPLYEIHDKQRQQQQVIYVTGYHLVYDSNKGYFLKVDQYENAVKTDIIVDSFVCLITDTHRIPIGNELFWDWEDHYVKSQQK